MPAPLEEDSPPLTEFDPEAFEDDIEEIEPLDERKGLLQRLLGWITGRREEMEGESEEGIGEIEPVAPEDSDRVLAEWDEAEEDLAEEEEEFPEPAEPDEPEIEAESSATEEQPSAPEEAASDAEPIQEDFQESPREEEVPALFPQAESLSSDPGLLLASLETIDQIREKIGALSEGQIEEFLPEEPEALLEEFEELEEEEPPPAIAPTESPEEVSSVRLQQLVDDLAKGLPEVKVAEKAERPNFLAILAVSLKKFIPAVEFTARDKWILGLSLAAALMLIASAIRIRYQDYGPGGDRRFYETGLSEERLGDYEEAISTYQKVLQRYPESPLVPAAHRRIAETSRASGDSTAASRSMQQALYAQQKGLGSSTSEWISEELTQRWKDMYFLGDLAASKPDWETAADWFTTVLAESKDPGLVQRSLYRLADALYQGSEDGARNTNMLRNLIEANDRALEASPEYVGAPEALLRNAGMWEDLAGLETGFKNEDIQKALDCLSRVRETKVSVSEGETKDLLEVEISIGRLYRELGRIEESVEFHRKLLDHHGQDGEEGPAPFKISFGLARGLLDQAMREADSGGKTPAESLLQEVLEITRNREELPFKDDEVTEALYLRGHAYYQMGLLHPPKDGEQVSPFFEKMDAAYQSALGRNENYGHGGEDSLLAMMRRTNYGFQINEDYREASRSYRKILEMFPSNIYSYRVRFRLGAALFTLGEYEEAEQQFQEVVDQFGQTRFVDDQAFRESYFRLGHCQFLKKDFVRSASTLKTLLQLLEYEKTPESLAAWSLMAEAYYSSGLYDEAVEEYRSFLARYPDEDQEGKIRLALGRTLIARFDYEEGRSELRGVIEDHPGGEMSRWSRYLICESYLGESKTAPSERKTEVLKEALAEAELLRTEYPSEDSPLQLLGKIHFELEDYGRAARDLEYYTNAARDRKPLSPSQLLLGESYFRSKQYVRAADQFQQIDVRQLSREEAARALFLWGESALFAKRFDEAASAYERLLKEFPASPYCGIARGRGDEVKWRQQKGI
jgi:tetratricopeptide (TPR) repeat protein